MPDEIPLMANPLVVTQQLENGKSIIRLEGDLVLEGTSPELEKAFESRISKGTVIHIDLEKVTDINTVGAAALFEELSKLNHRGGHFRFLAISPPAYELLAMVPQQAALEKTQDLRPPASLLEQIGESTYQLIDHLTSVLSMISESFYWSFIAPILGRGLKFQYVLQQISRNGIESIPILSLILFVIGFITALQADYQLRRFGASIYIADLVGVGLTRELGPLMAAVVLSGRSGAAMAAELGTMRVNEEIDALVTIGINPFKYLIAPRVLGLLVSLPALAMIGNCIGIFGGYVVAVFYKDIPSSQYLDATRNAIAYADVLTGLFKSAVFALIIALVGCYKGYYVKGGSQEIGKATTSSVVISLFLVIIADGFFTIFFYLFG